MNLNSEVIFIYLGKSLPKYAQASLEIATKTSRLQVRLIANKKVLKKIKNDKIFVTPLEDFYDESAFKAVKEKILLPHDFRNGFWLKTLERFFVLHQFMNANFISNALHAELDQLLFRCDILIENLINCKQTGLFLPFHSEDKAVASIFFCNDLDSLESFLNFSKECKEFKNEMELFALWGKVCPKKLIALPTLSFDRSLGGLLTNRGISSLVSTQIEGIVDAAQIGQWVAGEDSRNLPFSVVPKNKYFKYESANSIELNDLITLKLSLSPHGDLLYFHGNSLPNRLFNLHIHSKIHAWLNKSQYNFEKLIELSNSQISVKFPTTRSNQVKNIIYVGIKSFCKNPLRVLRNRARIYLKKFINTQ